MMSEQDNWQLQRSRCSCRPKTASFPGAWAAQTIQNFIFLGGGHRPIYLLEEEKEYHKSWGREASFFNKHSYAPTK